MSLSQGQRKVCASWALLTGFTLECRGAEGVDENMNRSSEMKYGDRKVWLLR